jgi:hypothetical protein
VINFDIFCKAKVDAKHGVVHAWAIVSEVEGQPYVDFHGDWIPQDAMYEASLEFADKARSMDEMHDKVQKGTTPFLYPMTDDVKTALGLTGKYTGLAASLRPAPEHREAILGKFTSGEYKGISIGGKRLLDEVVNRETGKSLGMIDCSGIEKALGKDATPEAVDAIYDHELDMIAKGAKLERNKLRRIMRKFKLHMISAVNEPAQEPADARLIKHKLFDLGSEKVASGNAAPESAVKQEPMTMADTDIAKQLSAEIDALKSKLAATEQRELVLKGQVDDLNKSLARSKVVGSLTGKDRDHYLFLTDEQSRDAFVAKSRTARDEEIKAAIIHEAADGTVYRVGQEPLAKAVKDGEELRKMLKERDESTEDVEIAKAAGVELSNLPEKDAHVTLMKAVRSIPTDKRGPVTKMLSTMNKAYTSLFKNRGAGGTDVDADTDAIAKMKVKAGELRTADPKLTEGQAFAKAAELNPELYSEYLKQRPAAAS